MQGDDENKSGNTAYYLLFRFYEIHDFEGNIFI